MPSRRPAPTRSRCTRRPASTFIVRWRRSVRPAPRRAWRSTPRRLSRPWPRLASTPTSCSSCRSTRASAGSASSPVRSTSCVAPGPTCPPRSRSKSTAVCPSTTQLLWWRPAPTSSWPATASTGRAIQGSPSVLLPPRWRARPRRPRQPPAATARPSAITREGHDVALYLRPRECLRGGVRFPTGGESPRTPRVGPTRWNPWADGQSPDERRRARYAKTALEPRVHRGFFVSEDGYLERALELARLGRRLAHPNPRVGAVVVADGEVVGEGYHRGPGTPHAEAVALEQAGERARGAALYVTLEPCCRQ